MPSKIDQRRLRDGACALAPPEPLSIREMESQISQLSDAIRALQSLDDLGIEANNQADRDAMLLTRKRNALEEKLRLISVKEEA